MKTFKQLFASAKKHREERIRKAGKHVCVKQLSGTMSRLTGKNNSILKRPVIYNRFYECKICGKNMGYGT